MRAIELSRSSPPVPSQMRASRVPDDAFGSLVTTRAPVSGPTASRAGVPDSRPPARNLMPHWAMLISRPGEAVGWVGWSGGADVAGDAGDEGEEHDESVAVQ